MDDRDGGVLAVVMAVRGGLMVGKDEGDDGVGADGVFKERKR